MLSATRGFTAPLLLSAALLISGCDGSGAQSKKGIEDAPGAAEVRQRSGGRPAAQVPRAPYGPPAQIALLKGRDIDESSGLAASRLSPGVFWTHNDSGDKPLIYAFDREGRMRGTFRVTGARQDDWEDIAAGPGPEPGRPYLYVGDIGDNEMARTEITVYRFPEPEPLPPDQQVSRQDARPTEPAEAIRLKYPDGSRDAETLMVHPATGDIYVVAKSLDAAAGVYKLRAPYSSSAVNRLERVGQVSVPGMFGGFLTGGDISPDGRRVVLCDYLAAYELSLPGGTFDEVWKQTPLAIDLGERKQGEAVCYGADGAALYATSEKRPVPLIEVRRAGT